MATAPNQVWSWDITRLLWAEEVELLLPLRHHGHLQPLRRGLDGGGPGELGPGRPVDPARAALKHGVQPRVLTLHSDRGAPMTSQCTAQLLADLGVTRSLSRPQVSDDNPFSEAQFKTLKYHPSFPGQFRGSGPSQDVLSIVLPLVQCRAPPWRHLDANPRAGPLRGTPIRSSPAGNPCSAKQWAAHPERFVRGVAEAQTAPGGRLHQSSHPFPHHTGHCSLINPVECPIVVDRVPVLGSGISAPA